MKALIGRVTVAATSIFVLAACAGDRPVAPDGATPMMSVGTASTTTLSCSFSDTEKAARALFEDKNDPVFAHLSSMKTALRTSTTAATPHGFNALREAAAARGNAQRIKSSATGATADAFTKAVFACTIYNVIKSTMDVASAWEDGVYDVRGGNLASGDGQGPAKSIGDVPKFGAAPTVSPNGWAAASRYLLWGALLPSNPFGSAPVTTTFSLETHPSASFANPIIVGICVDAVLNNVPRRLIHGNQPGHLFAASVRALASTSALCQDDDFPPLQQASGLFGLARRALSLFAPQEAYAFQSRGVAGLESSLSPFGVTPVDAANSTLSFAQVPKTETRKGVTQDPPVSADLFTKFGAPIAGAELTATVANNNGVPGQISYTETTDANGRATFSTLTIDSPGIYTMTITAENGLTVTSGTFHIRP